MYENYILYIMCGVNLLWNFGENEFISSGDMCVKNHNAVLVSAIVTTRLVHFRPLGVWTRSV